MITANGIPDAGDGAIAFDPQAERQQNKDESSKSAAIAADGGNGHLHAHAPTSSGRGWREDLKHSRPMIFGFCISAAVLGTVGLLFHYSSKLAEYELRDRVTMEVSRLLSEAPRGPKVSDAVPASHKAKIDAAHTPSGNPKGGPGPAGPAQPAFVTEERLQETEERLARLIKDELRSARAAPNPSGPIAGVQAIVFPDQNAVGPSGVMEPRINCFNCLLKVETPRPPRRQRSNAGDAPMSWNGVPDLYVQRASQPSW